MRPVQEDNPLNGLTLDDITIVKRDYLMDLMKALQKGVNDKGEISMEPVEGFFPHLMTEFQKSAVAEEFEMSEK